MLATRETGRPPIGRRLTSTNVTSTRPRTTCILGRFDYSSARLGNHHMRGLRTESVFERFTTLWPLLAQLVRTLA
jgi:hypothetical protein